MPLLLNIWNTLVQRRPGGGGFPQIPFPGGDNTKLYMMLATGQIPMASSLEIAVGLSRTLKI